MSVNIDQFWNLIAQSRLLDAAQIQHYQAAFLQSNPGSAADPGRVSSWLIEQNALSQYQIKVLLAGKSGPFFFGDYRVYDRIDSGRLQGRFRAVHQPTGHPVILEFLTGPAAQGGAAWNQAVRRVQAASANPHANLARPHEVVDLTTHKFLVKEDLRGQTLEERLLSGPLAIPESCALIRQAALGAAHLHGMGTAHGDIRPGNMWLTENGHVKLMHSPLDDLTALTPERADYAAPELANPGGLPTSATDVYAVGCTLYQSIVGKPPFDGGDIGAKMRRQANEAIQPLENFGVPKPLADAVMYMMAKNIAVRTPSMQHVLDQLAAYMGASAQSPPQPLPSQETYLAHLRQKRETSPAVAAAVSTPVVAMAQSPGPAISIATDSEEGVSLAEKRVAAGKRGLPLGWIAGGLVAAGVLIALLIMALSGDTGSGDGGVAQNGNPSESDPNAASNSGENPDGTDSGSSGVDEGEAKNGPTSETAEQGLPDDGKMLWVSPTAGENISFDYLPPGGQIFVVVRPADLLNSSGAESLKALDSALQNQSYREQWEKRAGVKLQEIEQLIISYHGNDSRYPRTNFMVKLKAPKPVTDLVSAWGAGSALKTDGSDYYKKGDYCFFPVADGSRFLMGAEEDVKESASRGGSPPAIRRAVEQLRKVSDATRHVTVFFSPNFFSGDGLPLFEGVAKRAREPLYWMLGDSLEAGIVSFHFDDGAAYGEVRLVSESSTDPRQLARQLQSRLADIHYQMKEYVSFKLDPPDYWRRIAFGLPDMVKFLHGQSRVGAEDGHAVLNFYVPSKAAPNLTFGGAMLMQSAPSRRAVAATPEPVGPKTFQELLAKPASMSFDQQSLEFAMRDISNDINEANPNLPFSFSIKIDGKQLELNGITRNQQVIGFSVEAKPLSEMLTKLVMKANPIGTVKEPNELDQKLVWVITDDPEKAGQKMILVTTRNGVATDSLTLPKVFVP